jgi:hypothetical protein
MEKATLILQNGKFWAGKECIENFGVETSWECTVESRRMRWEVSTL